MAVSKESVLFEFNFCPSSAVNGLNGEHWSSWLKIKRLGRFKRKHAHAGSHNRT